MIEWLTKERPPMPMWEHILIQALTAAPVVVLFYFAGREGWW